MLLHYEDWSLLVWTWRGAPADELLQLLQDAAAVVDWELLCFLQLFREEMERETI